LREEGVDTAVGAMRSIVMGVGEESRVDRTAIEEGPAPTMTKLGASWVGDAAGEAGGVKGIVRARLRLRAVVGGRRLDSRSGASADVGGGREGRGGL
jgi:hypothetical protein